MSCNQAVAMRTSELFEIFSKKIAEKLDFIHVSEFRNLECQ